MSVCSADTSIEWTRTPELTALITWNLSINEKHALPYSQQKLVSPKWSCTLTFWQIHAIRLKTSAANEIYEYSWMSKKKKIIQWQTYLFLCSYWSCKESSLIEESLLLTSLPRLPSTLRFRDKLFFGLQFVFNNFSFPFLVALLPDTHPI